MVAFFVRRAFDKIKEEGTIGLITTKTICQGHTRESGLTQILKYGSGTLYSATRRVPWPGRASVIVSVVHLRKGWSTARAVLDGKKVDRISAYLVPGTVDSTPAPIDGGRQMIGGYGNKPNGRGFVFSAAGGEENPLSMKDALLTEDCRNREILKPYLGGRELNEMRGQEPRRWIIDFGSRTYEQASVYPALLRVLSERVRPNVDRKEWWLFSRRALALKEEIERRRIAVALATAEASDSFAFCFVPSSWCLSNSLVAFSTDHRGAFCVMQSRVHETWVRAVSLTLKDDLRYVPGHCFETFPFTENWHTNSTIETAGNSYYEFRVELMALSKEGLTKTYNRFHDPEERAPGIVELRELHAAMDRVVLDAYGWTDIPTDCEFFLDHEIDEETWGTKKKPYRYRWPEEAHDEVLARLLNLNQKRYAEEVAAGLHAEEGAKRSAPRKRAHRKGVLVIFERYTTPLRDGDELVGGEVTGRM